MRGITGWSSELVREKHVMVTKETVIEDLYKEISDASLSGKLILHRHENNHEYKKIISEHIVNRLICFDALNKTDERSEKYYKNIINAIKNITDGHLFIIQE